MPFKNWIPACPALRLQIEALSRAYGESKRTLRASDAWRTRLLRLEDLGAR